MCIRDSLHRARLVAVKVAVDRRERAQVDARQERLLTEPVVDVRARDAGGADRAAVKPAPEGDDAGPPGDSPRELDRRLDRLRAGVHEEDRVERLGQELRGSFAWRTVDSA